MQAGGWPHQLCDPHLLPGAHHCFHWAAGQQAQRGGATVLPNCAGLYCRWSELYCPAALVTWVPGSLKHVSSFLTVRWLYCCCVLQVATAQKRYEVGLQKLAFTEQQVRAAAVVCTAAFGLHCRVKRVNHCLGLGHSTDEKQALRQDISRSGYLHIDKMDLHAASGDGAEGTA